MNTIMVILIDKRTDDALKVQEILTENGCIIETRLGMRESGTCGEEGLIVLKLNGPDEDIAGLKEELGELNRVQVKMMELKFDD